VLAAVDRSALLRLARQTGAFVEVVPVIGQYLAPGAVTLRLPDREEREILSRPDRLGLGGA
jgi:hypothetical protein